MFSNVFFNTEYESEVKIGSQTAKKRKKIKIKKGKVSDLVILLHDDIL